MARPTQRANRFVWLPGDFTVTHEKLAKAKQQVSVARTTPEYERAVKRVKMLTQTALRRAGQQVVAAYRHQAKVHKDDATGGSSGDDFAESVSIPAINSLEDLENELLGVAQTAGMSFLAQVKVNGKDDLFNQVNDRATSWAADHAAELVTGIEETTRDNIRSIITRGLDAGMTSEDIAAELSMAYSFSDDRASLIAMTEVQRANSQGALEGMREAERRGVKVKKYWVPDADACDVCLTNATAGAIDIEDTFPSGDSMDPAHPNCRCDVATEVETEDE